jgi:hypothetical protein
LVGGLALLLSAAGAVGQGTFVNLDFEHPITPLTPVDFQVPTTNGLPGWTAYAFGSPQSLIVYNTVTLGAPAVCLQGPGSLEPILQGSYTVILQGSHEGAPASAALGQTGQISPTAKSLVFWGYFGLDQVSFAGQTLPLVQLGTTAHYDIYGADISAFAGQTGQLLFTSPATYEELLDNIQFSNLPLPTPEPSVFGLSALGALLLGWRGLGRRR